MKQIVLFSALGLLAFGATAQEVGQVLSSTPVVQQVAVPRQICNQGAPMLTQGPTSGAGGVVGALIGGGIGSAIGAGAGHAAAIVGGTVLGAIVGNNAEASNNRYVQSVPTCTSEMTYENRTVAYNVTYEYAGRQYTTQMPYDPGNTLRLQVSPAGVSGSVAQSGVITAPPVQGGTVITTAPSAVVYQQPYAVYPAYPAPSYYPYYQPYYPPLGVSLGFVFGGRGGHRHWR
jgi:uncharacterized protein YcfJ